MINNKATKNMTAVSLVCALTLGLVLFAMVSEGAGQCLDGRSFAVAVTRCDGVMFNDVYCFGEASMTVQAIQCMTASAVINCEPDGATFMSTVGGVAFNGQVYESGISGTAFVDDCLSTFEGEDGGTCPCPSGAQEGTNPYRS